jgi:UDP-glucose 4-epimerase
MFEGTKILVTGGAGFIGSHLVEGLVARGAHVTSLDFNPTAGLGNLTGVIDQIETLEVDLVNTDLAALFARRFEAVFHLAGSAHVQSSVAAPQLDFQRNVVATLNLLEAIRTVSPHTSVVYTSSATVYAGGTQELIQEDSATLPRSPYGVSKLASERYVSLYGSLYGLRTGVGRLFTVFGPRLRKQIVFEIVSRLRKDGTILPILGDGTQIRDFSYVSDVVDALLLIAERGPMAGEAYNIASGEHTTIDTLARLIARTMGLSPTVVYSGAGYTGDTSHWFADLTRLRNLGYAPRMKLAEGIRTTVEWILQNEPIGQE